MNERILVNGVLYEAAKSSRKRYDTATGDGYAIIDPDNYVIELAYEDDESDDMLYGKASYSKDLEKKVLRMIKQNMNAWAIAHALNIRLKPDRFGVYPVASAFNESVDSSSKNFARKLARLNSSLSDLIDEANRLGLDDTDLTNAFSYIDSFLRDLDL